jgi:thiol-disulfide isomerase/thioredoxin
MVESLRRRVRLVPLLLAAMLLASACMHGPRATAADAAAGNSGADLGGPVDLTKEFDVYPDNYLYGSVRAPEFPAGAQWLNTAQPLTLAGLRGKVVLLDFWTYCCINCMHVIPELKQLEHKYPDSLVVIGVHSAKFDNEQVADHVRSAVLRYEIEHPVVNDPDSQIWGSYAVRAWPTLVLIDPEGKIIGQTSGEGIYEPFDKLIGAVTAAHEQKGTLQRSPLKLALERDKRPESLLSFPGKLAVDEQQQRLFISDSDHNRIIVAGLDGQVQHVIGSGAQGLKDGDFTTAQFNRPQGMAYDPIKGALYIADTENHAIRRANFELKTVETLAGDGTRADFNQVGDQLNSPWDVVLLNYSLFVAMAGTHQLWEIPLASGKPQLFAGNGRENIVDGPLAQASLAQPSGITTDGKQLYFADSEVSAIRAATPGLKGEVVSLVGHGLFDFGDIDGKFDAARLQHCIGVDYHEGALYVADSYNHKVKRLDLKARTVETLLGTGTAGYKDGDPLHAQFSEPEDVAWAGGVLYIADTNNSLIRTYDPKTKSVGTFMLRGLDRMAQAMPVKSSGKKALAQPAQTLGLSGGALLIKLDLPQGTHINPLQSPLVKAACDNPAVHCGEAALDAGGRLRIPVMLDQPAAAQFDATLTLELGIFYCDLENAGLCYIDNPTLAVPLHITTDGHTETELAYTVKM